MTTTNVQCSRFESRIFSGAAWKTFVDALSEIASRVDDEARLAAFDAIAGRSSPGGPALMQRAASSVDRMRALHDVRDEVIPLARELVHEITNQKSEPLTNVQ